MKSNGLEEISRFRKDIDTRLDCLQKNIAFEVWKRYNETMARLVEIESLCLKAKTTLNDLNQPFQDQNDKHLSDTKQLITMTYSNSLTKTKSDLEKAKHDVQVKEYDFIPDKAIQIFILNTLKCLGTLLDRDDVISVSILKISFCTKGLSWLIFTSICTLFICFGLKSRFYYCCVCI